MQFYQNLLAGVAYGDRGLFGSTWDVGPLLCTNSELPFTITAAEIEDLRRKCSDDPMEAELPTGISILSDNIDGLYWRRQCMQLVVS